MGQFVDLIYKIKKYFIFTPAELRGLIIAILITAFIISFKEWGNGGAVDFAFGLFNYFNALLIVTLGFLAHISAQRVWSLATGYRLEWRMWGFGLLIGIIIVFLTNGNIWLILPGGILIHHLGGHRLGWFRYDINMWALGLIAVSGPLASISLAILFKGLGAIVTNAVIQKAIVFNIAYALFSLLPIPPLDGSRTMYGSRMLYAFAVSGITAASILLFLPVGIGLTIVFSILIAILMWGLFYYYFENQWWGGG